MSDAIVLGAATQQNLLSLQQINTNLATTQGHLATGLKVASAVDNAVLFFQAQSLTNRANDLSTRKDNIDQGVSSLTTATQGVQSAISILQQMQGLLQSAKTQTATQRAAASTQFNTLAVQMNQLLNDSSYQGLNLVNSKTTNLTLQFSQASASTLKVSGTNLLFSALVSGTVKYTGAASVGSGHTKGSGFSRTHSKGSGVSNQVAASFKASVGATVLAGVKFSTAVSTGLTSQFDTLTNDLNGAISTAQAAAQSLGGNVSLLQTRLSFTSNYMTTLNGGASKLTVADVNLESTNLVTLQTRQSLAIQSLSIATQSESAVLRLFH
jgi:flagellin-like hook-associated protein FlgL